MKTALLLLRTTVEAALWLVGPPSHGSELSPSPFTSGAEGNKEVQLAAAVKQEFLRARVSRATTG